MTTVKEHFMKKKIKYGKDYRDLYEYVGKRIVIPGIVLFIAVLATATGCSSKKVQYGDIDLVKVSGTVLLDKKPLPDAQILFYDAKKCYSYGVTDAEGKYSLKFNSKIDGTCPGQKKVEIWTTRSGADFDLLMTSSYPVKEIVPTKYNRKTTLTANVSKSENHFAFDLDSNGTKTAFVDPERQTE